VLYCNGSQFVTVGSIATGSGSGLDADLLDGQHASAFAAASHNHDSTYFKKDSASMIGAVYFGITTSTLTVGTTYGTGSISGQFNTMGGTWRCLFSNNDGNGSYIALLQRIA